MKRRFAELTVETSDLGSIRQGMVEEAQQVHLEKKATDEAIGRFGAEFMPREGQVMTQCNAGALATGGIGTALDDSCRVRTRQKTPRPCAGTRPYLQAPASLPGTPQRRHPAHAHHRQHGGSLPENRKVGAIVTGADRIAGNGDTANKIGTYQIAVLAKENNVPSTSPRPSPRSIFPSRRRAHSIEERSAAEVTHLQGVRIAPTSTPRIPPSTSPPPATSPPSSPNAASPAPLRCFFAYSASSPNQPSPLSN